MIASFRFSKTRQIGLFLATQNVNVARFACNDQWDFLNMTFYVIFQTCEMLNFPSWTDDIFINDSGHKYGECGGNGLPSTLVMYSLRYQSPEILQKRRRYTVDQNHQKSLLFVKLRIWRKPNQEFEFSRQNCNVVKWDFFGDFHPQWDSMIM